MKKTKIVSLVLFIGVISLLSLSGCASTNIPDRYIIQPDPTNPFQGTWVAISGPANYIHIINGMSGELYFSTNSAIYGISLTKYIVYTIEENDNGFITSTGWKISVNDDILTVENMTYERFQK